MSTTTATPRLDGQSFKITVAVQSGMVDWDPSKTGNERASGYVIDILKSIASPNHANFTYDLFTPSGYGTLCTPQLERSNTTAGYSSVYFTQFNCGQSDVNDVPRSNTSTDMYVSSYYVSPSRQLANQFTIPFAPPFQGTLGMVGTATGITSIQDLVKQQEAGTQGPACVEEGSDYVNFLYEAYPTLKTVEIDPGNGDGLYEALNMGICHVFIIDYPNAIQYVLQFSKEGNCTANGKPIGVIGSPMEYGLNYYAFGVGNHIPTETVNTLSYWMNVMMNCVPFTENCPDGNFHTFYEAHIGNGGECGYEDPPTLTSEGSRLIGGRVGNWALFALFALKLLRF